MKVLLSLLLITSLLAPSLPVKAEVTKDNVPKILDELEDLGAVFKQKCLPKNVKDSQIKAHFEKNGLSEECWKLITRINHLETKLQKVKSELETKTSCENGDCKKTEGNLTSQVTALSKVNAAPMCTAEKKQQIKNNCGAELECVLVGSLTGVGGYLAEKILPKSIKPKNCNLGDDNCTTQLVTGFLSAAVTFFKGSWELLKLAGGAIGNKVKDLWSKVAGAEEHSSTSQLALAKASENKGFFDELTSDFPGTMKKIWQAFMAAAKEWLKQDIFCNKWEGIPRASKCLQPTESFDCISCKAMANGLCAFSGALVAEVVPAFLTGGLFMAVKHGVSASTKLAKLFKVSNKSMEAIKASRIGKMAATADDTLMISKGVQLSGKAATTSLSAINKYLLSPLRKALKVSYNALSELMKGGGPKLAVTPVGKMLAFTGTTLRTSFKVVLYPIDNPMTALAYRVGGRTFEKVLTLGKPTLATKTAVTSAIVARQPGMESLLAQIEEARVAAKVNPDEILRLEKKLLDNVYPYRIEAVEQALATDGVDLQEVIRRLYPELQFGDLAKSLPKAKVLEAERELYLEIARVSDTNRRQLLLDKYETIVGDGTTRSRIVGDVPPPFASSPRPLERTEALAKYNVPLTKVEAETKQAIREYMDKGFEEIVEKSRKVEDKIRNSSTPVVYDSVAVGAGPKNSILVGAMKESNPDLKVLVLESTDNLGTFHRVKGFDINSAEWIGDSGNAFPTSPVHLRDFNITNSAYATAEELGHATQATWQMADPDILFKTALQKVTKEPTPGAWPAKYKIETENGIEVYTRSIAVTPGLGTPVNRLKDTASVATVAKFEQQASAVDLAADPKYIPRFQDVEEYISNAVKDQRLGREAVARYKKKTTLLVGDGDGGSIGAEAALGLNKQLNPTGASTDVQLVWMGQKAKNSEEYVKGLSRAKQPRYGRIGEAIDDGRIKPVNGYLSRVEEFTNEAGETQFKAYYTTKSGQVIPEPVIVDNVVFATGYTHSHNTVLPYFSSLGDNSSFVPLHGKLNEFTRYDKLKTQTPAEMNKQLVVNGQKEDIYLTGLGGKSPISKRKMKEVTGGFLDIAGARAGATGEHIAQSLAPQALTKTKMVQLLTPEKGQTLKYIKRPVREGTTFANKEVVNIHTRMELGKTLRNFRSSPDSRFFISVMNNEKGEMVWGIHGLDSKSSAQVIDALSANPKLIDGLTQELQSNNRIDLMIPTRGTGAIKNEGLEIRTTNVYVTDPFDPTSRWPSALVKIMSPTLKSAGAEMEEEKERKRQEAKKNQE